MFCFLNQNPGSHPIPEDDVVKIEFYKDQPGAGVVTLKNEIAFALGMSMDKLVLYFWLIFIIKLLISKNDYIFVYIYVYIVWRFNS